MGPTPSSSGPVLSLGDECLSTVLQQFPDQPLDGFQTMHLLPDAHANPVPPLRDFFLPGAINVIHTLCFPLLNSSDRRIPLATASSSRRISSTSVCLTKVRDTPETHRWHDPPLNNHSLRIETR